MPATLFISRMYTNVLEALEGLKTWWEYFDIKTCSALYNRLQEDTQIRAEKAFKEAFNLTSHLLERLAAATKDQLFGFHTGTYTSKQIACRWEPLWDLPWTLYVWVI